ncbi:MAG: TrbG/VirB9 family P-type conjugative transfer protein [Bryobacterales bacterium]|nr:TrbG/VirB9 family P-type conjugative transfer protein [Bryobacterales bacterium]
MRLLIWIILSGAPFADLSAQKLEIQPPDTKKVVRVETAPDHLTVIEVADPVTMVAVGNQGAFTVERRENKVFVKPIEEGAKTNLFVWTTASRFAYELVPASSVEQMHFAIDQQPAPVAIQLSQQLEKDATAKAPGLPAEMLTEAAPILLTGERDTQGRVEITLRDLYRKRNRVYLRYSIVNHSSRDYRPTHPAAWQLTGVRSPRSLISLREQQVGERIVRSLKARSSTPLNVIEAGAPELMRAGNRGFGWLVVDEFPSAAADVSLIRIEFAADAKGTVEAVLVLPTQRAKQEVVDARAGQ